jgi:hypothetical protein
MSSQWVMTENFQGHEYGIWKNDKFECCRKCGLIRPAQKKKDRPCKGKPIITLRAAIRAAREGQPKSPLDSPDKP